MDALRSVPRLLSGRRGRIFAGLAVNGAAQAVAAVGCAWVMHRIFDTLGTPLAESGEGYGEVPALIGMLLAGGLALALLRAVERVQAERLGQDYAAELRLALYDSMSQQSPRRMQLRSRGATILRFVGDLKGIRRWIGFGLPRIAVGSISGALALLALASVSAWIAFAAAVGFAIGGVMLAVLSVRVDPSVREARRRQARLTANVNDKIGGIAVVQVFDQVRRERQRIERQGLELGAAVVEQARGLALLKSSAEFSAALASAAVLLAGAREVATAAISPSQLIGAVTVIGLVSPVFREFGQALGYWRAARVSVDKISSFLAAPRLADGAGGSAPAAVGQDDDEVQTPPARAPAIEFRAVGLGTALRDFSAVAPAGKLVAIVGPSGAGKSTLLGLAARLVEPDDGAVFLDGRPVGDIPLAALRRMLGVVMPDLPLLRGSIGRNLRYRWPGAPDAEVERVAGLCGIDELLAGFPYGARTRVADAGSNLSYGQRQRIAWARALLGHPQVLLLDEADANLDPASASRLARVLAGFQGTVLMVTHQFPRMMQADLVWYVEAGRLLESGTPSELMNRVSRTRRLFQRESHIAG